VDRVSGSQIWRIDIQGPLTAAPTLIGDTLVLGVSAGLIAGVDPATGRSRWLLYDWLSAVDSSAAPDKETRFFIGSSDMRRVSYMDAKDGRVIWRTDVFGWPWATPEVAGDRVFISAAGATPYRASMGAKPYPLRDLGSLSALDRRSGQILWRWQMPDWPGAWLQGFVAQPAADGDLVLVGGMDGTLYAFPTHN
jgi:outer membrane protein assembly factor BamB